MASTYPTQSQPRRIGDLIIFELHSSYNRVSALVKNLGGTAADILDPIGYPLKSDGSGGYALAYAGDEASVIGLLIFMNEVVIAASTGVSVAPMPILVRGPATVDLTSGIPVNDIAGSAFTLATLKTTLASLSPPIIALTEPTITATQSS